MSASSWVVAVLGAAREVGREVLSVLAERGAPVAEWRLYDTIDDGAEGSPEDFPAPVEFGDTVELTGADVVFLCGPTDKARGWAAQARKAGALCIDVSHALLEDGAVLIVPEVNGDEIEAALDEGLFACPVPGATALAVALRPLDASADLKRVLVTAFEPVSHAGSAGIDELAQQTRELLTGGSIQHEVFPHRIAFNLIPQVGELLPGGGTRAEWQLESQTRALLDLPDLPIAVTSVCVPTFYGQAYLIQVETERPMDADTARALLREAPGVLLSDAGSYPTLVDAIGSEATLIGRVRDDPTVPFGVTLWAVIDGLRKGGAVNAVQIAERALRERG